MLESIGSDIELAIALLNWLPFAVRAGAPACLTTLTRRSNMFARFIRDDQGQDLIEYLLLGSFIAIVSLIGATYLGTQLNNWYNEMGSWVGSAATQIP
jgi:Flp pilus assembly pilin Flp